MSAIRVCHISTFLPTQCGIATYAEDLIRALKGVHSSKVRMAHDSDELLPEFENTMYITKIDTYEKAIESINNSTANVVSLQHEFGIYGGADGEYVERLLTRIRKPIVVTLHTTPPKITAHRMDILKSLVKNSSFTVVLTEESKKLILAYTQASETKIRIIRHGIPKVEFVPPEMIEFRNAINSPLVFVSAGHLRPKKGYHIALQALAEYSKHNPHFKYLILGANQPQRDIGKAYAVQLEDLTVQLNLEDKVIRIDKYLDIQDMLQYIMAADIGLVTTTDPNQYSSGILPMILGCGRPVIATSFPYARSVAKWVEGIRLANLDDPHNVYEKILEITQDQNAMRSLMYANYVATRPLLWENTAAQYKSIFVEALN